jgi:hypothetical protein
MLDPNGANLMNALTAAHIGQTLATIVDGEVVTADVIATPRREVTEIVGKRTPDRADQIWDALASLQRVAHPAVTWLSTPPALHAEPAKLPPEGAPPPPHAVEDPNAAAAARLWCVTGKVTDLSGNPLPDVAMQAFSECGNTTVPSPEVKTNEAGEYSLWFGSTIDLPADKDGAPSVSLRRVAIRAHRSGWCERSLGHRGMLWMASMRPPEDNRARIDPSEVVLPGQPGHVDFVMLPAASVNGVVLDVAGRPMAQRTLWLVRAENSMVADVRMGEVIAGAETDAEGRFAFADLPRVDAWIVTPGANGSEVRGPGFTPDPRAPQRVELVLIERPGQPAVLTWRKPPERPPTSAPATRPSPTTQPAGAGG